MVWFWGAKLRVGNAVSRVGVNKALRREPVRDNCGLLVFWGLFCFVFCILAKFSHPVFTFALTGCKCLRIGKRGKAGC